MAPKPATIDWPIEAQATAKKCPKCECEMELESATDRPSWRELFYGEHQPTWWRNDGSG